MLTGHEIGEVTERLAEDDIAVLRDALLELLLQVATIVLVLAQTRDLADEDIGARARESVNLFKSETG